MSSFIINGGKHLVGEKTVTGAKNGILPLLAATYLCDGKVTIHNCPELTDVSTSIGILKHLGCKCSREKSVLTVDSLGSDGVIIPERLMREMRSSIVFLGAVAAKCGKAVMSLPGGCELGPRPIDIHIDALKRLGADIEFTNGQIICNMPEPTGDCNIHLNFPSVGATENIILAASKGKGTTVVHNAAREPEIKDLAGMLNSAGADIKGAGTSTVLIKGVNKLHGTEHTVMPDRIVAASYLFAVAMCKGKITLNNIIPEHIVPFTSCLYDCGCEVKLGESSVFLKSGGTLKNFDSITTQPFPGFPTDAGPALVAAASVFKGTGVFVENIFDSRFRYIGELSRLGANIRTVGRTAVITGVKRLHGAQVTAHDLRGGAALVSASMAADGQTEINNIEFIDRGYEHIEDMFSSLGADIKRC